MLLYYYSKLDKHDHLAKYICGDSQEIYFLQLYKKCLVFLTTFANLNMKRYTL